MCSDVEGLEEVTLVELWFFHGGGYDDIEIRKASDVFAAMAAAAAPSRAWRGCRARSSR